MKQAEFERTHAQQWRAAEALFKHPNAAREPVLGDAPLSPAALPSTYRLLCAHYAICKERGYSPSLVEYLHGLCVQGHQALYHRRGGSPGRLLRFFATEFPRMVRRHAGIVALAALLFFGSLVALGIACYLHEDLIYSVMDPRQVAEMQFMYDPETQVLGRDEAHVAASEFAMFGYYIANNISIGFRTFAAGIFFGVGTVVILLFNGVTIGAVAGYLTSLNYYDTFWPFVVGHSAFELSAIVICGAAGLVIARALLAPRNVPRGTALRAAGMDAGVLVMGAAAMLLVAAFVEAFWSAHRAFPNSAKFAVGAIFWVLVAGYFAWAGRRRGLDRL